MESATHGADSYPTGCELKYTAENNVSLVEISLLLSEIFCKNPGSLTPHTNCCFHKRYVGTITEHRVCVVRSQQVPAAHGPDNQNNQESST